MYRCRTPRLRLGPALALGCGVLRAGCGDGPCGDGGESASFSEERGSGSRGNAPGLFVKPRSIAIDRDDNVYVCDMTGRVQKFHPDGNYLLQWQMPEIERGRPKGMALEHEGNIVVVEPHYSRINHFTPVGKLVSQWGPHGRERGELSFPRALAIAPDGSHSALSSAQRRSAAPIDLVNSCACCCVSSHTKTRLI